MSTTNIYTKKFQTQIQIIRLLNYSIKYWKWKINFIHGSSEEKSNATNILRLNLK
jgi:hypothetical protein